MLVHGNHGKKNQNIEYFDLYFWCRHPYTVQFNSILSAPPRRKQTKYDIVFGNDYFFVCLFTDTVSVQQHIEQQYKI